jgi:hypothetical protein
MTVRLCAALYLRVSTARQAEHDISIRDLKSGNGSAAAATVATTSGRSPGDVWRSQFCSEMRAGCDETGHWEAVIIR